MTAAVHAAGDVRRVGTGYGVRHNTIAPLHSINQLHRAHTAPAMTGLFAHEASGLDPPATTVDVQDFLITDGQDSDAGAGGAGGGTGADIEGGACGRQNAAADGQQQSRVNMHSMSLAPAVQLCVPSAGTQASPGSVSTPAPGAFTSSTGALAAHPTVLHSMVQQPAAGRPHSTGRTPTAALSEQGLARWAEQELQVSYLDRAAPAVTMVDGVRVHPAAGAWAAGIGDLPGPQLMHQGGFTLTPAVHYPPDLHYHQQQQPQAPGASSFRTGPASGSSMARGGRLIMLPQAGQQLHSTQANYQLPAATAAEALTGSMSSFKGADSTLGLAVNGAMAGSAEAAIGVSAAHCGPLQPSMLQLRKIRTSPTPAEHDCQLQEDELGTEQQYRQQRGLLVPDGTLSAAAAAVTKDAAAASVNQHVVVRSDSHVVNNAGGTANNTAAEQIAGHKQQLQHHEQRAGMQLCGENLIQVIDASNNVSEPVAAGSAVDSPGRHEEAVDDLNAPASKKMKVAVAADELATSATAAAVAAKQLKPTGPAAAVGH
eukprot:gene3466-3738_t